MTHNFKFEEFLPHIIEISTNFFHSKLKRLTGANSIEFFLINLKISTIGEDTWSCAGECPGNNNTDFRQAKKKGGIHSKDY